VSTVTYKEAIRLAIADALEADDSVFMLGEDIAAAGGAFKTTEGLMARFGENRVLDTPISEQAIIGTAIGAAIRGLRPIAELMFADFAAVCFDQIANQLAKYRYMTGGQVSVPVTVRLANGAGAGFGAQHSQTVENWFINVPGLKIAVPGSPADAYGLLRAAVEDEDPVLYFEHKAMLNHKGELPDDRGPFELGRASVVREGTDVTVVATQLVRVRAEQAAERLAADGISVELIDPRTLVPLDIEALRASVERTSRLVVVQESPAAGSWGATVVARLIEESFDAFDAPPLLLSGDDTPVPYAGPMEQAWIPSAERIETAIRRLDQGA
jgi:acetoin:2,6-dichlorophenolindophenol oxidoreductase subunit beta